MLDDCGFINFLVCFKRVENRSEMAQGDVVDVKQFLDKIDKLFDGTTADQHEAYTLLKANSDKVRL